MYFDSWPTKYEIKLPICWNMYENQNRNTPQYILLILVQMWFSCYLFANVFGNRVSIIMRVWKEFSSEVKFQQNKNTMKTYTIINYSIQWPTHLHLNWDKNQLIYCSKFLPKFGRKKLADICFEFSRLLNIWGVETNNFNSNFVILPLLPTTSMEFQANFFLDCFNAILNSFGRILFSKFEHCTQVRVLFQSKTQVISGMSRNNNKITFQSQFSSST